MENNKITNLSINFERKILLCSGNFKFKNDYIKSITKEQYFLINLIINKINIEEKYY